MDQLSAAKSKRQFYRILRDAADKAVCQIETENQVFKKRKIDIFSREDQENNNFNILYKYSQAFPLQENNNNNVKKQITQNDNTVNIDSFSVSKYRDNDNEQNEQICNKIFNSSVNYNNNELIDKFSLINVLSRDENFQTSDKLIKERVNDYKCNENINVYLQNNLKMWAVENNISRTSFQQLLKILNEVHPNLPIDPRSIFGKSNNISIETMGDGQYYNFNLKNMLQEQLKMKSSSPIISLKFNVDGLPLFKSSRIQLWPILCLIEEFNFTPIVCAVYCGKEKPDLKLFLKDFVPELKDLMENGIIINDTKYTIFVRSFICDAPARAFLKGIKGHGGYYGCEKCVQKGQWKKRRVIFPDHSSNLRTDKSFAERKQKKHHKEISPLIDIGINMITMFPLDPMHLVFLGVMRKLLHIWTGGKLTTRMSAQNICILNKQLEKAASSWPKEFNRKPRGLHELNMWKATEYRQFLLYLGPTLLTPWLPKKIYKHFLLLHASIFILSRDNISEEDLVQAEYMLRQFVISSISKDLYGKSFLIYNVHNLLHLVDDVRRHGPLHKFSAFPFENKLASLKRAIRGKNKPLQQLVNRTLEKTETDSNNCNKFITKDGPILKSVHSGPCLSLIGIQYKMIRWHGTVLSLKEGDNIVITSKNDVIKIINFVHTSSGIFLIGKRFQESKDLYSTPCKSSNFHIYIVKNLCERPDKWHLTDISYKAILVQYKARNAFAVFPMHNF